MSHAEYDKFFNHLKAKGIDLVCPVCGCKTVTTTSNYVQLPIAEGNRTPFKTEQYLYATCDECGYLRMFKAK